MRAAETREGLEEKAERSVWRRATPEIAVVAAVLAFLFTLPLYARVDITSIVTKVLIYALLAKSLDLIFGYAGLVSLGHAAFFGTGGYAVGLLVLKGGIASFWLATPAAVVIVGLLAAVYGLVALRASGVYFILLTFALGQLTYSVIFKWSSLTGGKDGLAGIPPPDFGFAFSPTIVNSYYFVFAITVTSYALLQTIMHSTFGHILKGIGESELRMGALGYNVWMYKYIAFIIAAMFAGLAGTCFAYVNWFVAPVHVDATTSALAMVVLIVGGSKTVWGPLLGAAVILFTQYAASLYVPERWPLVLGLCFVVIVMFARGGLMSHVGKVWTQSRNRLWNF